jgi:carbon-monoxide dehydrogenase large subunit
MRIGESQVRIEDDRLLTGKGRYTADHEYDGAAHLFILRSPLAAGKILELDVSDARALPGVIDIITRTEVEQEGVQPLVPAMTYPAPDGGEMPIGLFLPVAGDEVRHVGEPVAAIIAESREIAEEAADLILLDIEERPSVTDCIEAIRPDAPKVWPDRDSNEVFLFERGDRQAVDDAFARAAHVVEQRLRITRITAVAMEPRASLASYDAETGTYKLVHGAQSAHRQLPIMASILNIEPEKLHLVVSDTGGGFGMKNAPYAEYMLSLVAAKRTGRRIRWVATRLESFMGDAHARDQVADAALALDADHNFLAIRLKSVAGIGAYVGPMSAHPPTANTGGLSGVYRTPHIHVSVTAVHTNTMYTAPYRGAGRPEATYILERLIDIAAVRLGRDRSELREQNMIQPDQMPYDTGFLFSYDSGNFPAVLSRAKDMADWSGFPERRKEALSRNRLRGLGISCPIEIAGGPIGSPAPEFARIELTPEGKAIVFLGSVDSGQGHQTSFRQVLCQRLGIGPADIEIIVGDSQRVANGVGSFGSRSMAAAGTAINDSVLKIAEKLTPKAGEMLETHSADIEFEDGLFRVKGTDRSLALSTVAAAGGEMIDAESFTSADNATFPNGCHICEVEVDPDTGAMEMMSYIVVDDVGTVINPLLLKGQIHGGVAQGAGQALLEDIRYDPSNGQMLTASFMDYGMPRADTFSAIEVEALPAPTSVNPLGVKGAGEAGTVGALPACISAVCDAIGVEHLDMPATPERIWRALNGKD